MNASAKFRPYFTATELLHVITRLKTHPSLDSFDLKIITYLETFAIKIERGVVVPSMNLKPTKKEAFIASLDLDGESKLSAQDAINRTERAKELFKKWMNHQVLSPRELELVMEYRYENELMTNEESASYEETLLANAMNKHT